MSKNYFAIECDGNFIENVVITDPDGNMVFEELLNMTYDEMKSYEDLENFVVVAMGAANSRFETNDAETLVTLIGEDDVFIWSIIIGPGEEDEDLKYVLVDWKKDGKNYRYQP